jgi:hypothetical protein
MSTESLYEEIGQMVRGEIRKISRQEFRERCDEEDKVIYLGVARQIAKRNRCEIHVNEDDFEFVCPPWSKH